jgi:Ca2+-transporting ATPase
LTFVSAVASDKEESVLNAVQLLWVNLIMDTFAALALATDPPSRSVLDRPPERKSAALITLRMMKMILGQAICQLAITFCIHFGGKTLLGYDPEVMEDAEVRHKTLVFNTFVWLQIFNEVNNRRLDNKLNIFEGIQRNYFFIVMNCIMVGGQILIIFKGGQAFKITALNGKEWGMSIGLGAISVPWGACIRLFPDEWVAAMLPWFIRKSWAPETISKELEEQHNEEVEFEPPLRTLSTIRGRRVTNHIGFREKVHHAKRKAKGKLNGRK